MQPCHKYKSFYFPPKSGKGKAQANRHATFSPKHIFVIKSTHIFYNRAFFFTVIIVCVLLLPSKLNYQVKQFFVKPKEYLQHTVQ